MCSPYLTGSLGIMLCLVTFNYWSVSTQNSDLVKKVQEMQQQLMQGTKHIESLEEETREIRKQLKTYKDRVTEEKELKNEVEMKLSEDKEMQSKAMDSLRDELEEVKVELISAKTNLTRCQDDLTRDISEKVVKTPEVGGIPPRHLGRSDGLGPGQLPDVHPEAVSVVRKETQGSGLIIEDSQGNSLNEDKQVAKKGASPSPKVEVMNLSSSRKPVSPSPGGQVADNPGVDKPNIVVNEAGVMPLPNLVKSGEGKAGFDNLDNAEDDSQIAQHENGPEGKKEIQDDDQNPDGQIDETVDLDKQHYLVDKAQEEFRNADDGAGMTRRKFVENSLETIEKDENGDNLESLKESLNNIEQ